MTTFTTTSPINPLPLPAGVTEIGGIVVDMIGSNGQRVTGQISASTLFSGFYSASQNPGQIGGFTSLLPGLQSILGGGLQAMAIRITLQDGDTSPGNFDENSLSLLVNGVDVGSFSGLPTQRTNSTGATLISEQSGFPNSYLATGWFEVTDTTVLQDVFDSLASDEMVFEVDDDDPGDNFFDFGEGVDGGLDGFEVSASTGIVGTANDDILNGTAGDDIMLGLGGNDSINGFGGLDVINGGEGEDTIDGGSGNDIIQGASGNDSILGSGGDDDIFGGTGDDEIDGGTGNDSIQGGTGNDTVLGGGGDDEITDQAGNDTVDAGSGNDTVEDGLGTDSITLGGGTDVLIVTDGDMSGDTYDGGAGVDTLDLTGTSNRFIIDFDAGTINRGTTTLASINGFESLMSNDDGSVVRAGNGVNTLDGGSGDDVFFGMGSGDVLNGGAGRDRLFGGDGNDLINGGDQDDRILGIGGDDTLNGDDGNDTIIGGAENDTLSGGADDDRLVGQDGDDRLLGGSGDDRLIGGTGSDSLIGGPGNDVLVDSVDTDSDTFVYALGSEQDRINGFDQGSDILRLDDGLWTGTLTGQEVVDMFGSLNGTGTILTLTFSATDVLEVQNSAGVNDMTLGSDIVIF